jgi:hypothetical protein
VKARAHRAIKDDDALAGQVEKWMIELARHGRSVRVGCPRRHDLVYRGSQEWDTRGRAEVRNEKRPPRLIRGRGSRIRAWLIGESMPQADTHRQTEKARGEAEEARSASLSS